MTLGNYALTQGTQVTNMPLLITTLLPGDVVTASLLSTGSGCTGSSIFPMTVSFTAVHGVACNHPVEPGGAVSSPMTKSKLEWGAPTLALRK